MKAKLGISIGLMGALIYLMGLFGGVLALTLIAGYVLIAEENAFLRQSAVKALAIVLGCAAVNFLIGLLPDTIDLVLNFIAIFGAHVTRPSGFYGFFSWLSSVVSFCENILLLVLAVQALKEKTIKIGFIDNLIGKHIAA